jgi:Raf kinase inhibitor-like YbhB/YbcL family protein
MDSFLKITSSAFLNAETIPIKYTCDGENINPEIIVSDIPEKTKTLVIIVEDSSSSPANWTHWLIFNIPVSENQKQIIISANSAPGTEGMNDFMQTQYKGPCPSFGSHRYFFRVYALSQDLNMDFATKQDILLEMKNFILAKGEIMGEYK